MATSDYDGSDFVGLDDDAFGDGEADTLPAGTWLQHRLQANLEYCASEPRLLCFSPVISNADDFATVQNIRPYTHCAGDYGTVWFGFVKLLKDQTGLDVSLAYTAFTIGGTSAGDVQYRLTLRDRQGTLAQETGTLAETETTGSPDIGVATISLDFDRDIVDGRDATLWVEVRSTVDTSVSTTIGSGSNGIVTSGSSGHGFTHQYSYLAEDQETTSAFWAPNDQTSVPSTDARECMYVEVQDIGVGTIDPKIDIAAVGAFDAYPDGTFALAVQTPVPRLALGEIGYQALIGPSFWLRAMAIEPQFDNGALDIRRNRIYPNIEFGSAEAFALFSGMHSLHLRPRLSLIGPRGKKDDTTDFIISAGGTDREYAIHWPFVMGNDTGDDQVLVEDALYLQTESPELVLEMTFVHVQHETRVNLRDGLPDRSLGDKKVEPPSSSEAGSADWDITVIIDQLDDAAGGGATWASNTTEYLNQTETVSLPLFPASLFFSGDSQPPIALMQEHMHGGEKGTAGEGFFHFKEGTVFGDLGDGAYLIQRRIRLSTSSIDTTVNALPFRFKVSAEWSATEDWLDDSPSSPENNLRLVLASYSLFEIPTDPSASASDEIDPVERATETLDVEVTLDGEPTYTAPSGFVFQQTTAYVASGANWAIRAVPGSAGAIVATENGTKSDIFRIDASGGSDWSTSDAGGVEQYMMAISANHVLVHDDSDGEAYNLDTSDGSAGWSGGNPKSWSDDVYAITPDETSMFSTDAGVSNPNIFREDPTDGSVYDTASYSLSFGKVRAMEADNSYVAVLTNAERFMTLDISSWSSSPSPTIDIDLTNDPTQTWSAVQTGDLIRRDGSGGWWLLSLGQDYAYHVTSGGTIDIEIDVVGNATISGTPAARGLDVDDSGRVFVSVSNGTASEVLAFDSGGSFIEASSTVTANGHGLAVDSSGNVYLMDSSGDVSVWEWV